MNRLTKGLFFSVLSHLVVIGLVCLMVSAERPKDVPIEVDLTAVGFPGGGSGGGQPGTGSKGTDPAVFRSASGEQGVRIAAEFPNPAKPVVQETGARSAIAQENTAQGTSGSQQQAGTSSGSGSGTGVGSGTGSGVGSGSGSGVGSGLGDGQGAGHYIAANYNYILALIQRHVTYPQQARMMGIEGKAIYQFTIRKDGHIEGLSVIKSAGFDALDAAGLKAIKKAAPFPAPPAAARLKVPLVFSLR